MLRLLANLVIQVIANAVGLAVAASILDQMTISSDGFVVAVLVFTVVSVVLQPLITQIAITNVAALRGATALVTTFAALLITHLVTDGLHIHGFSTWVLATLIVWLFTLIAAIVLPLFLFKKALQKRRG